MLVYIHKIPISRKSSSLWLGISRYFLIENDLAAQEIKAHRNRLQLRQSLQYGWVTLRRGI
jgi:hypothetical protein